MDSIYGEFNAGGSYIDINMNKDQFDVLTTNLHELCHQELASNSYIGAYNFLLMRVFEDSHDIKIKEKIVNLHMVVEDSSLAVQESAAMFQEFAALKVFSIEKYNELMDKHKNITGYYYKYRVNEIEFLLDYISNPSEAKDISWKVIEIALLAMNIPIASIDPLSTDSYDESFKSNERFFTAMKFIKDNQISISRVCNTEIRDIFSKLGYDYLDFSWERFKIWATENLLEPLNLLNVENYVNYHKESKPFVHLLSVSANNSNIKSPREFICNTKEAIETAFERSQILYIKNSDNDNSVLNVLINYHGNEAFRFKTRTVFLKWFSYIPIVFTDRNNYFSLVNKEPKLENYGVLVDLGNVIDLLLKEDEKYSIAEYYIYTINQQFVMMLFKGNNKNIYFHITTALNASILEDTYLASYSHSMTWWDEIIPLDSLKIFVDYIAREG